MLEEDSQYFPSCLGDCVLFLVALLSGGRGITQRDTAEGKMDKVPALELVYGRETET